MRVLFILLVSLPLFLFSQQRDKRSAPFTVRSNIGIPQALSSGKFRTAFKSVIEGNISFNARTFDYFFVGLGYQYTNFQCDKDIFIQQKITNKGAATQLTISYNTRFLSNSVFLKIGYDKFFEKGFATVSLNSGYAFCHYNNVVNDSAAANLPFVSTSFDAPYLQPEVSVSFLADRSLTFSVMLAYTTMFSKFDPKAPRFADYREIKEQSNKYFMSWLNIGFGCTVLLGKR